MDKRSETDPLAGDVGRAVAVEGREVRRFRMRSERRFVVIDFVKQDAVGFAIGNHDIELPAARFVTNRGAGVFADELAESFERSRP